MSATTNMEPNICTMPDLVMEKIVDFLDFKAVLTLRHVCHDLRNFVDDLKSLPDSKFTDIDIVLESEKSIRLNFEYQNGQRDVIEYSKNSRSFNGRKTKLPENLNIEEVAISNLKLLLKFQKSNLKWFFFKGSSAENDFPNKLSNILSSLTPRIKTENLQILAFTQSQFMSILPFFDAEVLKQISFSRPLFDTSNLKMDEIVKTEQWRKAEQLDLSGYNFEANIENFVHFLMANVNFGSIFMEDLEFLRKRFLRSSEFQFFSITTKPFNEEDQLSTLWGPSYNSLFLKYWFFKMTNSDDRILKIRFSKGDDEFEVLNFIDFCQIDLDSVPHGAVIQE